MTNRRDFLKYSGIAAAAIAAGGKLLGTSEASAMTAPPNKVVRVGNQLQLNGYPYRAIGCDIWGMAISSWSHPADYNGNSVAQLAGYLSDIRATAPHVNAIRVFMVQQLAINNGVFDYSGFDTLLSTCDAAGFKVIGILQDSWSYERTGSQTPALTASWFNGGYTNTVLTAEQIPYRQWAQQTVTRYANDPRILFWELCNEANNLTGTFVNDMCSLLHSIDPNTPLNDGFGWSSLPPVAYYGVSNGFDIMDFHYYTDYNQTNWQQIQSLASSVGIPWIMSEMGVDTSLGDAVQGSRVSNLMSAVFAAPNSCGFLYWQYSEISGDQFKITAGSSVLPVLDSYVLQTAPTPTPSPPPTPPPTQPAYELPTYFSATPYWNTINLGWSASPEANANTTYHIQMMAGDRLIKDFKTSATHAHVTGLRQNTRYRWRLQVDADTNYKASPWSIWRYVTTK